MSIAGTTGRLELPDSLRGQLLEFRRRVWAVKTVEAACGAAFGVLVAYLLMFAVDRFWDAPTWLRATLFVLAAIGLANVPLMLHRWIWSRRHLEQLARLLS